MNKFYEWCPGFIQDLYSLRGLHKLNFYLRMSCTDMQVVCWWNLQLDSHQENNSEDWVPVVYVYLGAGFTNPKPLCSCALCIYSYLIRLNPVRVIHRISSIIPGCGSDCNGSVASPYASDLPDSREHPQLKKNSRRAWIFHGQKWYIQIGKQDLDVEISYYFLKRWVPAFWRHWQVIVFMTYMNGMESEMQPDKY